MIPKAELHVHLEGTAPPELVKRLAARHHMPIPENLFTAEGKFAWTHFLEFLKAYDLASSVIRQPEDYRDVTYEYLAENAKKGVIYVEMMSSPDHAALSGMGYQDHLDGIIQGIDDARRDYGIEGRIIIAGVRHFGTKKVTDVAKLAVKHAHPYVVGLGLGGDEANFPASLFTTAYQIAHEAGLGTTVHAGEVVGPESVRDALKHLPVTRLGHGVRIIEDQHLVDEIIDRNITLEVCPTSNIALSVYPTYEKHPLRQLQEAGVNITLNSDDPPFFDTTVDKEYHVAKTHFGFTDAMLCQCTRQAIMASFADEKTKAALLQKIPTQSG